MSCWPHSLGRMPADDDGPSGYSPAECEALRQAFHSPIDARKIDEWAREAEVERDIRSARRWGLLAGIGIVLVVDLMVWAAIAIAWGWWW